MRTTTLVILALAAVLLAGLAFREGHAARQARLALGTAIDERDALRERLARAEQERETLTAETARLRDQAIAVATRPPPDTQPPMRSFTRAVPHGRGPGPMAAFDSPEMRQLMAIEQKGRLDANYAALFQALRLPPDQLERLKQLLVDKQSVMMDVLNAARRQDSLNAGSGTDVAMLVTQEQETIDKAIRNLLGDTAFEEFQEYERTGPQRNVVDQLANRLSYTDDPLSPQQAQALVDLLTAERAAQPAANAATPLGAGIQVAFAGGSGPTVAALPTMDPGGGSSISENTLSTAQGLLTAAQMAALRELQAEQQAQQQLRQAFQRNFAAPGATASGTAIWVSPPATDAAPVAPRP